MADSPPQPLTINQLFDTVYPSFAMLAGMELDLFTPLKDGPLTAVQIADAIDVPIAKLRPLLYTLVVAQLLTVDGDLFTNTDEANHFLVRGRPNYVGGIQELTSSNWARILKTAETIRLGTPPTELDYHSTQEELIALFRGLYSGTVLDAQRLMNLHNFSRHQTLLDIGGGSGGLAITLAQANPNLDATVMDLPSIIPITQQFVEEANLTERIEILATDIIKEPLLGKYDVVVARHLHQVLSENENRMLLKKIASVVNSGGVIYLVGWILDNTRLSPSNIVGYNLVLLNAYKNGEAYTEQEYYNWLAGAGFINFERHVMPDGISIIVAYKPR